MRIAVATLIVLLVSACSLYTGDDVGPEPDAGAPTDATANADACVCEVSWPTCPVGCEPPAMP